MRFHLFRQNIHGEKKLLQLISQADEPAFEILFNTHKNDVYNVAHKFTQCDISSEEIVQEAFMIIWQRREKLTDIDNFSAYLITITKHLVYKSLKEKARKSNTDVAGENATVTRNAEALMLEKEYEHILQKAVNRLPQQQQKVYLLVKENGLKRDEVADMLKVAPDTVKFHLAQAMKSIRAYCSMHLGANFF
ncbi:MAG: sigma-70 family RNA polymerase sigma factor [Agriterribacter sp.]